MKTYKSILVLPDIHLPWGNWGAIKQARRWYDSHEPELVIQLGDITDQKIWSRWTKDVDDYSPSVEFDLAAKGMEKLYRMFPDMTILRGNHDERIKLKAIESGLPGRMFKDVDEVFNYPGWTWVPRGDELRVRTQRGPILFLHGDEMGGTPAQKSRILGISTVQGHTHKASIVYTKTASGHFFGAEMGSLMDVNSRAARYAQANPVGVSTGFGVIKYGVPYFISYVKGGRV